MTQALSKAALCDYSFVDEEIRNYSMARGTSVHWLTQLEDQGALDYRTVPKALRGYRKAWNAWKDASGFTPVIIEEQFVSRFGFAGIIDRVGGFRRSDRTSTAVVDIKTGQIAYHVRFQLCAYTVAAAGDDPARAKHIRRIAVRLKPDGTYGVKEFSIHEWPTDWAEFMEAVRVANDYQDETEVTQGQEGRVSSL